MTELANAIEAILFYLAEPLSVARLTVLLKESEEHIREALVLLEHHLSATGLRLLQNGNEVALGTAPFASAIIEAITKEELSKDLSKASLETLAIVLYKSPISRAEIDYIRGVNSTFILRNLLVRGLVEKLDNPQNQRSFLYKPTFQLLEYMGVTKVADLPEFDDTVHALESFVLAKEETEEPKIEHGPEEDSISYVDKDEEENRARASTQEVAEDLLSEMEMDALLEVDADIAEENDTDKNFIDEEVKKHLAEDESSL